MTTRELVTTGAAAIVHAELSASSAYRWWNCPGSIRMIKLLAFLPDPSIYALRGTAMHTAAAQWLRSLVEPDWVLETFDGFELEEDEIDAVRLHVETILEDQRLYGGDLIIEHRFSLAALREGMFGTNDAMLVNCRDGVLRIYDLKGGRGVAVEVEWNLQELYYGVGALLSVKGMKISELELVIIQGRKRHVDGPVRRWRIDLVDTFDWTQDLLDAAARTDDPNAPLKAGEWCVFCPARFTCKEHASYVSRSVHDDFQVLDPAALLPDPQTLTAEEKAALLSRLDIFEHWVSGFRAHCHAEMEAGRDIPGFKLVAKRGRRTWVISDEQVVSIVTQLGVRREDLFKFELKSPAQIEKLLRKTDRACKIGRAHV